MKIRIEKDHRTYIGQWFAITPEGQYIHKDGSTDHSVYNTQYGYTGRYRTREEARKAVRLYRSHNVVV